MKTIPSFLCAVLLAFPAVCHSATYVISPFEVGSYYRNFFGGDSGQYPGSSGWMMERVYAGIAGNWESRPFFGVNLSSIPASEIVTSVRLTIQFASSGPRIPGPFNFTTTSMPLSSLVIPGNNKTAEFDSLGTGTLLASGSYDTAVPFEGVTFDLTGTPEFVALLNQSRSSDFVLSARNTSIASWRSNFTPTLYVETVPELGSAALTFGGVSLLLVQRRRRGNAA